MKSVKTITTFLFAFFLISCNKQLEKKEASLSQSAIETTGIFPHPDHIVFIWLENKGYDSIVGNPNAPYINSLIQQGTLFLNEYAVARPSQPNYIAFFSGTTNGVTSDAVQADNWSIPNLFSKLRKVQTSFAWYSEDLPEKGSKAISYGEYMRKHNPTANFSIANQANKPFKYFPKDYTQLEQVACITPNMIHDMHNGTVQQADQWINTKLSALVEWSKTHNSIVVIYFDEGDKKDDENKIPVIAIGEPVKEGYVSDSIYNHYSWTKTICSMFHADKRWTDELINSEVVSDCWK